MASSHPPAASNLRLSRRALLAVGALAAGRAATSGGAPLPARGAGAAPVARPTEQACHAAPSLGPMHVVGWSAYRLG